VQECSPVAELTIEAGGVTRGHGQTREALEQALTRLFAEDLIIGTTASDISNRPHLHMKLSRAEVEAELRRPAVSEKINGAIVDGFGPQAVYYWFAFS